LNNPSVNDPCAPTTTGLEHRTPRIPLGFVYSKKKLEKVKVIAILQEFERLTEVNNGIVPDFVTAMYHSIAGSKKTRKRIFSTASSCLGDGLRRIAV